MSEKYDIKTLENSTEGVDNPFELFDHWFELAKENEPNDPNAMTLATCTKDGKPSARIILLKEHDERGFVFYTNVQSRKGQELANNENVALVFYWKTLNRQIRVEGHIERVGDQQADNYYNSRGKGSRIGAWASRQSQTLENRTELQDRVATYMDQYGETDDIPRPPHWGGFRVVPHYIEFWHDGAHRLHTRLVYERDGQAQDINENTMWTKRMLYP